MTEDRQIIHVQLGPRAYPIVVGTGLLDEAAPLLETHCPRRSRVVFIADAGVAQLADSIACRVRTPEIPVTLLTVDAGETSKSIEQASRLWDALLKLGTDRRSLVVAVGGGVVGDLAGFVAATYARGVDFCQVPTTLLAQVDSSVGGKTGINLPGAKNMIGAFWQPALVLIDTDVLSTLPSREYQSGLAEVVKYGVILDAELFGYLENHVQALLARDAQTLRHVIARSCRLKADVVETDERETTGLRAVLNYGHTFAHAVESVAGYGEWLHGEAVAMGMVAASRLAETLGRIPAEITQRQQRLLESLQLPTRLPELDDSQLLQAMSHDKKVEGGRLRFVLPDRLGHVELVDNVDPQKVRDALAASRA